MQHLGRLFLFLALGAFCLLAYERYFPSADNSFFPGGSPDFETSFSEAKKQAVDEDKPLLVVFSASWCPPCRKNKKDLYPAKEIQPFHDRFVWVYLDVDIRENKKIGRKYGVKGIPDIRIMNGTGKDLGRFSTGPPEAFKAFLERGLAKAGKG